MIGSDLEDIKIVQGGLIQLEFINTAKKERYRVILDPFSFFQKLGEAMDQDHIEWLRRNKREVDLLIEKEFKKV